MWNKKLPVMGSESVSTNGDYTFLGKGVKIEGAANLEGVVRIDGHFDGAINTNDMLIIGEEAVIRGSISADEIICSGRIEANLNAKKRIQLLNPAVVIGDVVTASFSMEEGVFFQGKCDMGMSRKVEGLTKEAEVSEKGPDLIEDCELVSI